MAKKSEELIKNESELQISKPNMKVSRKSKSTTVSEKVTTDTISVDSISNAKKAEKTKRTIHLNIPKTNSTKNDKKEVQIETVKNEAKKPNKTKRTLKLNLPEPEPIVPARPKVKEISINQNASFFYTPSVFEKFSICVTDEEQIPEEIIETEIEENIDAQDTNNEQEVKNSEQSNEYDFESNDIFDINSITITPIDEIIEEPINEVIEEAVEEKFDSTEENDLDELIEEIENAELPEEESEVVEEIEEIDEDYEEDITEEDIENFLNYSLEDLNEEDDDDNVELDTTQEPTQEENDIQETEVAEDVVEQEDENDSVEQTEESLDDVLLNTDDALLQALLIEDSEISEENLLESDDSTLNAIDEEILSEAADNIELPDEATSQPEGKKNIIGKFFDSSIPSMVENGEAYFSKIKKSIFNNVSNVFKKFSYDEAELVNAANQPIDEVPVKEQSVSDIVQNLEDVIGKELSLNTVEVQADPIATIETPTIDEALLSPTSTDSGIDGLYTNILTPETNTSTDEVSIDDELLEEALLNEFSFEDLEEVPEVEETESKETEEEVVDEQAIDDTDSEENEEEFDIEAYFGITDEPVKEEIVEDVVETPEEISEDTTPEESFDAESFENILLNSGSTNASTEELISKVSENMNPQDLSSLSQLLTSFNNTITTLSDRISSLEGGEKTSANKSGNEDDINLDDIDLDDLDLTDIDMESLGITEADELLLNDNGVTEDEEPSLIDDFDAFKFEPLEDDADYDVVEKTIHDIPRGMHIEDILSETLESVTEVVEKEANDEITNILSKTFSEENSLINEEMKKELLAEVLSVEQENEENNNSKEESTSQTLDISDDDPTFDFLKIIDSLSKTISELEKAPDTEPKGIVGLPVENPGEGKAINILINKDDIFSISIQNETYEIIADFDGISVLSENIHISTPKHNFYVQVGDKYIEIHNKGSFFTLDTSFEDIEFANAINNVSFAKKNNKIELNIKDAFKLSSVNNKVSLSMLNTSIANISKSKSKANVNANVDVEEDNDSSVCDNKTLLISEETQKVYLPYSIDEVMKKLNNSSEYQTIEEVVEKEYTLPLSTFKMPIISRFKEAYRFMRVKEKSSVYAAVDLALELMFNSNLNPAVIRAAKDLKELNVYLDCLYENEIDKFDCFKIVYKVLPKIQ